jgi:hypothetical protein
LITWFHPVSSTYIVLTSIKYHSEVFRSIQYRYIAIPCFAILLVDSYIVDQLSLLAL